MSDLDILGKSVPGRGNCLLTACAKAQRQKCVAETEKVGGGGEAGHMGTFSE